MSSHIVRASAFYPEVGCRTGLILCCAAGKQHALLAQVGPADFGNNPDEMS